MTTRSKQSATALTDPFPWTLWPNATTISKQRALNGNMDNVEGQDVLRKRDIRTTHWCSILKKKGFVQINFSLNLL